MKFYLFLVLGILTAAYIAVWLGKVRSSRKRLSEDQKASSPVRPDLWKLLIGFGTNFLDTLGIGSFATTASIYKIRKIIPDELLPGTLNVGHALPVIAQAFIYIALIEVDVFTLVALIAAAVAGAWIGAPVVARWPRRTIRIGLGSVLIAAAVLMLMSQLELLPVGGNALALSGAGMAIGVFGSFWLGALMTLGLGFYAPCMILISMLGMNPKAAFPIMMGACAFLMPVASVQFVRRERYSLSAALGLTLGGIPGVLLAAFIVRELSLDMIRWLVVIVVVYTAITMLRSAFRDRAAAAKEAAVE